MENPFLKTFGRPARELACECERESESNLSQALQLIGGETVNGKLRDEHGRMAQLAKSGKRPEEITRDLYLVALSREPTRDRAGGRRQTPCFVQGFAPSCRRSRTGSSSTPRNSCSAIDLSMAPWMLQRITTTP